MKKIISTIIFAASIFISASVYAGEPNVYHVVLVDLKDGVTAQQIEEMTTVGKALLANIPGVLDISINKKAREDRKVHIKDYDLGVLVKWENNKTGDIYAPHVLHQTFLKLYKDMFKSIRVIDFYGNENPK
ncbi:MAG: Dabb family protein [Deltaproteobacteria bacterium]|nr:Dabb family protein [Deltaproteobacteria bacterium]